MNRAALEHILRAAAAISDERDLVVVGSQAVLAQFPHAPLDLLASIEADVFPRHAPTKSILIDGAIGKLSAFHQTLPLGIVPPSEDRSIRFQGEAMIIPGANRDLVAQPPWHDRLAHEVPLCVSIEL